MVEVKIVHILCCFVNSNEAAYRMSCCTPQLVEQDSEGQCNSECKTIERACQEVRLLLSVTCVVGLSMNLCIAID